MNRSIPIVDIPSLLFRTMVKLIDGLPKPTQTAIDRWDDQDEYSFEETYGTHLIDKGLKVFPQLTNEL